MDYTPNGKAAHRRRWAEALDAGMLQKLSHVEAKVMTVLDRFANWSTGECSPGIHRIASMCFTILNAAMVSAALRSLRKKGLIQLVCKGGGRGQKTVWRLLPEGPKTVMNPANQTVMNPPPKLLRKGAETVMNPPPKLLRKPSKQQGDKAKESPKDNEGSARNGNSQLYKNDSIEQSYANDRGSLAPSTKVREYPKDNGIVAEFRRFMQSPYTLRRHHVDDLLRQPQGPLFAKMILRLFEIKEAVGQKISKNWPRDFVLHPETVSFPKNLKQEIAAEYGLDLHELPDDAPIDDEDEDSPRVLRTRSDLKGTQDDYAGDEYEDDGDDDDDYEIGGEVDDESNNGY